MSSEQIAGKMIEFDAEGYMSDASVWDETIAAELAKREGIEQLTERHWMIINFMRKVFQEKGEAPSIRKLNKESGVDTRNFMNCFRRVPPRKQQG